MDVDNDNLEDSGDDETWEPDVSDDDGDASSSEDQEAMSDGGEDGDASLTLTWRMPPNESFSDWKIVVEKEGGGENETYHVHKHFLAAGSRKSEYFRKLFQNEGNGFKALNGVSQIQLNDLTAGAFPDVLDFLYSSDGAVALRPWNATAILHLADFFDIPPLRHKVYNFCRENMAVRNMHIYYKHALALGRDDVKEEVANTFAKNVLNIKPSSRILSVADPDLLANAMGSDEISTEVEECDEVCDEEGIRMSASLQTNRAASVKFSKLLVAYCEKNKVDSNDFERLTYHDNLPVISESIAFKLIKLGEAYGESEDAFDETSLKWRCLQSFQASYGSRDMVDSSHPLTTYLRTQSNDLIMKFLAGCLEKAEDRANLAEEREIEEREEKDFLERKVSLLELQREEAVLSQKMAEDELELALQRIGEYY